MKGKQLLVPAGDNLKRPIPAPAVTLSQQPHTILDPAAWPEVVGISLNGYNTLYSGPAPTLENTRPFLGWWRHCLPAHQCMGIYSAALCMLTDSDDLCGIKVSIGLPGQPRVP
ncbi:hypothetical protein T09_1604 [Trichinella sp. T9]|nr:hypothetical protein T09_1604 [Trichinella sp. T9]